MAQVCPFSMSGEVKQCHPMCVLIKDGECCLKSVAEKLSQSDS